ncbi:MAG: hypothetical protein GX129_06090 [Clostridiales bacterium]|nr:hypothetical protein [Clostridiales bacterium]
MNNQFNFSNYKNKFTKGEGAYKDTSNPRNKEKFKNKNDEDLIIEENTIYEIDRNCVERLKRNRKR